MALNASTRLRNRRADVVEEIIGTGGILRIRSGAKPTTAADARTGIILAEINLPADFLTAAVNGVKSINGTWTDAAANGTGPAGYFDIEGAGGVIDLQGTVTITGGGGDLQVDNTSFATNQPFTITAFTLSEPNG